MKCFNCFVLLYKFNMADVQTNIRLPRELKDKIKSLVEADEYRDVTDFIVSAIREKLEREDVDETARFKSLLLGLIESDPDVKAAISSKKK